MVMVLPPWDSPARAGKGGGESGTVRGGLFGPNGEGDVRAERRGE